MTKFSAQIIGDLLTTERNAGRLARIGEYAAKHTPFHSVVFVEADDGSWCEFDAESAEHAKRLADNIVRIGARGASCRELRPTGRVKLRPFYTVFADADGAAWETE